MIIKEINVKHENQIIKEMFSKDQKEHNRYSDQQFFQSLNENFEQLYKTNNKEIFASIINADEYKLKLLCISNGNNNDNVDYHAFLNEHLGNIEILKEEEITISNARDLLSKGYYNSFITHSDRWWADELRLRTESNNYSIFAPRNWEYNEKIYEDNLPSKEDTLEKAKKILASESLIEEIERIYSPENTHAYYGHPVHYYISAGSWGAAQDIIDVLVPAFLFNKRLKSKRLAIINKISPKAYQDEYFSNLFASSVDSCIAIDFSTNKSFGNYAQGIEKTAEMIGNNFREYGKDALFFFVDISGEIQYRDEVLASILGNGDIIKIDEGFGNYNDALNYLNDIVDRSDLSEFKEDDIYKYLPDKISYSVSDIYEAFYKWYGSGLKTHIYKAYRNFESVKIVSKKIETEPYLKLQEMVGLKDIKRIVDEIITFNKVKLRRKELGLKDTNITRHMLFYGNPGTAKTTVARLLSQILKDEGILENGHLVECGRQDLVGRYVGWTAKTVEEKFNAARGGILFIDEAYSLVDDSNSFGTEAINTIVQLMETFKDEVICIFAGYPEKMKSFIANNEGLASRIAFQLDFPDYNSEELLGILELMLKENDYTMDNSTKAKCKELFDKVINIPNFGNGRFVRNFLDQAELAQSTRILKDYKDLEINKKQIKQILKEDINNDFNFLIKGNNANRIGFDN